MPNQPEFNLNLLVCERSLLKEGTSVMYREHSYRLIYIEANYGGVLCILISDVYTYITKKVSKCLLPIRHFSFVTADYRSRCSFL